MTILPIPCRNQPRAFIMTGTPKLEQALVDNLAANKVPEDFNKWLLSDKVQILTVKQFALRIEDANEIQSVFVDPCNAFKSNSLSREGDIAGVKITWRCASDIMKKLDFAGGEEEHNEGKPMGTVKYNSLSEKWSLYHHFVFTSDMVVTLVLANRFYKPANAEPRQFCIAFPEPDRTPPRVPYACRCTCCLLQTQHRHHQTQRLRRIHYSLHS